MNNILSSAIHLINDEAGRDGLFTDLLLHLEDDLGPLDRRRIPGFVTTVEKTGTFSCGIAIGIFART